MSELEESVVRSQAILMMARNHEKENVIKRILKRFMRCVKGRQMPNKAAKMRKQQRFKKNKELQKKGRTRKQYKKKLRYEKNKT